MRIAYWITEAADTNSEFVILIPFLLQNRLHESFVYTNIACLIINIFFLCSSSDL